MYVGLSCLVVFAVMAALMYSRRISALLALPIMAVLMAVFGGIAPPEILSDVISSGVLKLHNAYATTIVGAVLAELVNKHGIAKAMVRWVAEFAGDNPFVLGCLLTAVTSLLFSSLGGLGAVIMVGTVVLPVMLSLGISPQTAGGLFLFGISLGGMFNLGNWPLYIEVLKVNQTDIVSFVVPFAGIVAITIMSFLAVELKQWRNWQPWLAGVSVVSGALWWLLTSGRLQTSVTKAGEVADENSIYGFALLIVLLSIYALFRLANNKVGLPGFAFLTPIVPLVLVLVFHWAIIPAFMAGIIYGVLITASKDSITILTRAIIDGGSAVIPAVVLMMGIGMLLCAVMHPSIAGSMAPFVSKIVPTHGLAYILIFGAMAPLSLYRGPLSLWGMGSGLVALMQKTTALSASAIMGMLMSVGQLQGICDPTNTHNVWIATYLGVDTQALLRKTIIYAWLAAFAGLVLTVGLKHVAW